MTMNWIKIGQIFNPKNQNKYLISHAANPLAVHLEEDTFRIFYSGRNIDNKSSVGYVDIDIISRKVINYPKGPIVTYGPEDSFYSHGISIGNLFTAQDQQSYILFMGWQVRKNSHWKGDIGRLNLSNKKDLEITPNSPFMGIDKEDNISLSYPFVLFHNSLYRMWYGSTIDWSSENGEMIHVIKYATSKDGITWKKHGIAIPYEIGVAQAFSRPSVIINESGFHMWYCYRSGSGESYRIGYSKSENGKNWINKLDNVGINVSAFGWDSEMICYPFVFQHKNNTYMLYNGNNFGKTGFGLAKLESN